MGIQIWLSTHRRPRRFYHRRMPHSQEIIISIDRRIAEARSEIASLEAALAAIGNRDGAAPAAASAPRSRANGTAPASRTRRRSPRKPGDVVPAGKLQALLTGGDGMSTGQLVDRTGGDRQQVLTLLRELEADGQVRRTGERRGTRWHAITDEDRIAARVAELERQRSRPGKSA
ncbi:MAG TPA: hypothetical protein VG325_03175 [Solirubrobacteraceae bacterium]|nr:hypothetical protein [Solirubrobacteraceae bacterium]